MMNELIMKVVKTSELTTEQQIRMLRREITWHKVQLDAMAAWLNNNKNKGRHNYKDVVRRSRGMQFAMREKQEELDKLTVKN